MKKLIILSLICIVWSGSTAFAQKDFQRFYSKHRNDPGVESFELTTSLFRFLLKGQEAGDNMLNNINRVSIFMVESADVTLRNTLYSHLPGRIYKDLMAAQNEGSNIRFKVRETREGIEELLLIADKGGSLFVLSVTGFFSYEEVATLSRSIDVSGYTE